MAPAPAMPGRGERGTVLSEDPATLRVIMMLAGTRVYVEQTEQQPVSAPHSGDGARNRLLADLIEARSPLEAHAAAAVARNAPAGHLRRMRRLLAAAAPGGKSGRLSSVAEAFHHLVVLAAGNAVTRSVLQALSDRFREEHRLMWEAADCRECDHQAHLRILEALENRDDEAAAELMRAHLASVRDAVLQAGPARASA